MLYFRKGGNKLYKWILIILLAFCYSIYCYVESEKEISVAVIDSGLNDSKLKEKYTILNFSSENSKIDNHNHGTAISHLVADNKVKANYFHLKVLNKDGETTYGEFEKAIDWCLYNKVDIINISFGFSKYDVKLSNKIDALIESGTIIIASSGNNFGGKSDFPAIKENVVSVGGLDKRFHLSDFSSSGKIDVYNLSENIESINNKGNRAIFSGNSFATALTTNEIIKMKGLYRNLNSKNLKSYTNDYSDIKINTNRGEQN